MFEFNLQLVSLVLFYLQLLLQITHERLKVTDLSPVSFLSLFDVALHEFVHQFLHVFLAVFQLDNLVIQFVHVRSHLLNYTFLKLQVLLAYFQLLLQLSLLNVYGFFKFVDPLSELLNGLSGDFVLLCGGHFVEFLVLFFELSDLSSFVVDFLHESAVQVFKPLNALVQIRILHRDIQRLVVYRLVHVLSLFL